MQAPNVSDLFVAPSYSLIKSKFIIRQAAGTKGKRFAMPSTRIMMHQPAGGAMGSADEVNIQASELNRTMKVSQ